MDLLFDPAELDYLGRQNHSLLHLHTAVKCALEILKSFNFSATSSYMVAYSLHCTTFLKYLYVTINSVASKNTNSNSKNEKIIKN